MENVLVTVDVPTTILKFFDDHNLNVEKCCEVAIDHFFYQSKGFIASTAPHLSPVMAVLINIDEQVGVIEINISQERMNKFLHIKKLWSSKEEDSSDLFYLIAALFDSFPNKILEANPDLIIHEDKSCCNILTNSSTNC